MTTCSVVVTAGPAAKIVLTDDSAVGRIVLAVGDPPRIDLAVGVPLALVAALPVVVQSGTVSLAVAVQADPAGLEVGSLWRRPGTEMLLVVIDPGEIA